MCRMSSGTIDPFTCFGEDSSSSDHDGDSDSDHHHNNPSQLDASAASNLEQAHCLRDKSNNIRVLVPITNNASFKVFDAGPLSGKGLRAISAYKCGDEIIRESAAMRIPNSHPASSLEAAKLLHQQAIQRAYNSMHHTTQCAFMDLSSCDEGEGIKTPHGIYDTNSFRLEDTNNNGALFLTIARINHSCHPNVNHIWRENLQQMLVFATRDIQVGEELCTSYGPSECMTTQSRREYLYDRFSFQCMCTMCVDGNKNGGDERMMKIQSLQEDIALSSISMLVSSNKDSSSSSSSSSLTINEKETSALESVTKCLALMNEQGIGGGVYTKSIYHHGYDICMACGNVEGAKAYLVRELKAVRESEGVDSPRALEIEQVLNA